MGDPLPLGYDLKDGTLVVVEEEAERVRLIFRRYLQLSGINELVRDFREKSICTKARTYSTTGETRGGSPFGRGPQLAKRERCTVRQVNLTLSLAFLAPQLVKAAVEGRLPCGINIERLRDPNAEWSRLFVELGLDPD